MKKDATWAVRAMSGWLASPLEFGAAPIECEVCYRKPIPVGSGVEPCFLVRYKMKRGPESIGFVGPLTWSFIDLPLAEIEEIPARWRMRRMLNLYIGWYLAFAAGQRKPRAPLTPKQTVTALTTYLKRKGYLYELRAPEFVEGVAIAGVYYAVVRATAVFADAPGKRVWRTQEGFVALTVSLRSKAVTSVALIAGDAPVYGKLPLYHHIGTQIGPFEIKRLGRPAYTD